MRAPMLSRFVGIWALLLVSSDPAATHATEYLAESAFAEFECVTSPFDFCTNFEPVEQLVLGSRTGTFRCPAGGLLDRVVDLHLARKQGRIEVLIVRVGLVGMGLDGPSVEEEAPPSPSSSISIRRLWNGVLEYSGPEFCDWVGGPVSSRWITLRFRPHAEYVRLRTRMYRALRRYLPQGECPGLMPRSDEPAPGARCYFSATNRSVW